MSVAISKGSSHQRRPAKLTPTQHILLEKTEARLLTMQSQSFGKLMKLLPHSPYYIDAWDVIYTRISIKG